MRVTCSSCSANYTIADDKVRSKRVKLRCKKCGNTIVVDGQSGQGIATSGASAVATTDAPLRNAASIHPVADTDLWTVNLAEDDEREMAIEEIAQGFVAGTVTEDAFIWKEGMEDWVPVLSVPEVKQAIDSARAKAPRPGAQAGGASKIASGIKGAAGTSAARGGAVAAGTKKASVSFGAPTKGGTGGGATGQPAKRAATAKPSAVADLFSAAAKAGSEEEATSAPGHNAPSPTKESTGSRNENSVLFSLDALKAGFASSGRAPQQPTTRPGQRGMNDILSMPSTGRVTGVLGLGTADLLTAPAPPPPPEPKKPKKPELDAEAVTASVPSAEPSGGNSSKKKLVIAAAALAGLLLVGGLIAATSGDDEEAARVAALEAKLKTQEEKLAVEKKAAQEAEAEAERAKKAKEEAERLAAERAKAAKETAEDKEKDDAAKDDEEQKVASRGSSGPSSGSSTTSSGSSAASKKPEPATPKKEAPKVTVSDTPSSGVASFNTGAARSALSVAASGAVGCKRADGPTGSGRVMVTFATSGRVTAANVVGAPFAGTAVGGCVATIFRRATVPPFSGNSVTVAKSFSIP